MLRSRSLILTQLRRCQLVARQLSVLIPRQRYLLTLSCTNALFSLQSAKKSIALRLDTEIIGQKRVSWIKQLQRAPTLEDQIRLLQNLQPISSISGRMRTKEVIKTNIALNLEGLTSIPTILSHFEAVSTIQCDVNIRAVIAEVFLKAIINTKENLSFDDLRSCLQYTRRMHMFVTKVDFPGWMLAQVNRHLSDITTIPRAQLEPFIIDALVLNIKLPSGKETSYLLNLITDSERLFQNLQSDNSELPFLQGLSFGSIDFNHLDHDSQMKLIKTAESFFNKDSHHDTTEEAEAFFEAIRCLSYMNIRLVSFPEGAKCFDLIRMKLPTMLSSTAEKSLPKMIEALYRIGFNLPEIFSIITKANPHVLYGSSNILFDSFYAVSQAIARQQQKTYKTTILTPFLLRMIANYVPLDYTEQDKIELCRKQPEEIAIFLHLTLLLLARETNVSFYNFENNDKKRVLLAAQRSYRHLEPNRFADLLSSLHSMKVTFDIMEKSRLADDFFLTIEKRADGFTSSGLHKLMRYLDLAGFNWRSFDEKWEKSLFHAVVCCINPAENVNNQLELLSGLSALTFRWHQLPAPIHGLVPWIGSNVDQWNSRTHLSLVWALGRLRCLSREIDPAIMSTIKQKMVVHPMLSANGYLLMYSNLSRMGVSWSELPQSHIMNEFIRIKDFKPSNIAQVIAILGRIYAKWGDFNIDFKETLVKRLQSTIAQWTETDLASVMYAISYLTFDSVYDIEQDQHLMTVIKTIIQQPNVKRADKFKSFDDRQHAQLFFEFLATFPAGQLMIAQSYDKRLEEKFVPIIDPNPFADDGSARKKGLINNVEVTLEIGNVIGTLLQGTGYAIRADIRPVHSVFGQELTIVSRANKLQPLAIISLHWTLRGDTDTLERLDPFRRYFYNFHYPEAKVYLYAAHGVSKQELKADAEKLTTEILRRIEERNM